MKNKFLIAAATSNSGKTTITMGLLRALRDRGLKVQPYKCGPDFIDTMFHEIASGRESVNLDTFMSSKEHVCQIFQRYGEDADVCVVEGVMGLFDGYDKMRGSSAEIAMLLDIPIILVVNAKSTAYSVAPLIYGFKHFNPKLKIAGVIFNMVASENHYSNLKSACEDAGVTCFGYLGRNEKLVIPGRHLGLTIQAKEETESLITLASEEIKQHLDLDTLFKVTESLSHSSSTVIPNRPTCQSNLLSYSSKKIAIAKDEAFNFTYRVTIDSLKEQGEVMFFSPLRDKALPKCDMLYLPGGYPELFMRELTINASMRKSIKDFAEQGGKIFAECGGFMYLCNDIDGTEMCGVFPFSATMEDARLHLGYRVMGEHRGHEFHYSTIRPLSALSKDITIESNQCSAKGIPIDTALYHYKNVTAGYTHWYDIPFAL